MTRGLFITFEGGDGAGKTTLMNKVAAYLAKEGFQVISTREPGGTILGEEVRKILLRHSEKKICSQAELLLFLTSRAQHIQEKIEPALQKGKIVLCDRFNDSSIVYQGLGRNLGLTYVQTLCQQICGHPIPDLTLYIDLPSQEAMQRVNQEEEKDRIEEEDQSFYQTIREGYQQLANENPQRIHTLNGAETIDSVYNQARAIIEKVIKTSPIT